MSTQDKGDFARLPIKWIQGGSVAAFDSRVDGGARCLLEQNTSLGALRLYVSLCMIANYYTGQVTTTYPKLIALSGLSRPIVARSLKRLVEVGLLEKYGKPLREGTVLQMAGWEENFHGKLPKSRLYDGSRTQLLVLHQFEFSALSLYALKVFLVICAFRNKDNFNIATINYSTISRLAGVPMYQIPGSLNRLYHLELISYKQADYYELGNTEQDRTNRYLVRGLGDKWPAFNPLNQAGKGGKASKAKVAAANEFVANKQ
ncbi:hypothetical protein [Pseudomonas auratipiscis]|uniref:Helix-turn-helix domain-containing protein n=1 Tax=Pseudomonas auratipiscis TaxID=3115853 RepID=A0AB35WM64_9PSED|nr:MULTISPECIES: hypothetical protein [unclassified Pseudomonas]MEE1865382.1 hypothetical protein [Pseudomonas sp. 120P]MEE1956632.1 hypothetical protein [Pseudomonas sp. 119P]